jgi:inorganic pyrophosphatase
MATDFNKLIKFGKSDEYVNTVVEIPKDSSMKIEYDRELGLMVLDRVEPAIFAKPVNYGFIPGTLDDDGDELDTLVVTAQPLPTGLLIKKARVIGIVNFEDDSEMDHKIIVVPSDDRHSGNIKDYKMLGENWQNQIEHHFNHYKDLKKQGTTNVLGFGDVNKAWKIIEECVERFKKQQSTPKDN